MKHFFKYFVPRRHIPLVAGGIVLVFALSFVFGLFVMILWNWLMPELFHLPEISYFQAWGLVILSHILFKGGPDFKKHRLHSREEWKEKFRKRMEKDFFKQRETDVDKEDQKADTGSQG